MILWQKSVTTRRPLEKSATVSVYPSHRCTTTFPMFPTIDYQRDYSLIVDRDGFKAALIELGNSVIGGYRSDEKRRRVLAEVSIQANRIPAVQERQATAINRTMDALKDILLHGLEIGAFSDETDVMLYVQILYTVLEGASNTVAQDEDIDEKAVWAGIVELMFK